jgi:ABC-type transport system involved in multi-copper enzyme maturation permease subunit
MKIYAIALNTFREAVRHRILYLLFLFAAGLIASARVLGELTVGDKLKIIADVGLSGISLSAAMIGLFLGIGLVSREMERRTIHVVLAKPIARAHFLFGKALGLTATILVVVVLLGLELLTVLYVFSGEWKWILMESAFLAFFEALVILAFSVAFSTFTTPILAAFYTLAFYVIGHLSWTFQMLASRAADEGLESFWYAVYLVLPNLERFNIRAELVHGVPVDFRYGVALPALYGVLYALFLLLAASVIFERKDMT